MTINFKGLISIWLTVIMLLGLMVSPIQVGAAGNEGEVLVYKHNTTPVVNDWIDVDHSADHYTPSDGQRLIDDETSLCKYKGAVALDHCCRKFVFDPLKAERSSKKIIFNTKIETL